MCCSSVVVWDLMSSTSQGWSWHCPSSSTAQVWIMEPNYNYSYKWHIIIPSLLSRQYQLYFSPPLYKSKCINSVPHSPQILKTYSYFMFQCSKSIIFVFNPTFTAFKTLFWSFKTFQLYSSVSSCSSQSKHKNTCSIITINSKFTLPSAHHYNNCYWMW